MLAATAPRTPTSAATSPTVTPRSGYMPGLDGLRAVAVIAVLLYHADVPWIPGGFLGVEVFFVISGYLITLLLTEEFSRSSRISLPNFWLRRARRLLPALYALLALVSVGVLVNAREEAAALGGQVWSALCYVTNWYFIVTGQSYFAATERPPVFQHLWSLAIEEQFYLLWPLAVIALARVLGDRDRTKAKVVFGAAVASIVWMAVLHDPVADPSRVYYGTDTRAGGLLLGAGLAYLWRPSSAWRDDRRQRLAVDALGVLGLALLVVCFARLDEFHPYLYRGGFTLVGVATLLAIMAAVHPATGLAGRFGLAAPVLTWIGLRSYALYLWHWPIFVFTRPELDQPLGLYPTLVIRLAATVGLAELSYRYVEVPIRNGALGRWWGDLGRRPPASRYGPPLLAGGATALLLLAVTTAGPGPTRSEELLTSPAAVGADAVAAAAGPTTVVPAATPSVTVVGDSVLAGAQEELTAALSANGIPTVDYRAEPAWQVDDAARAMAAEGRPVGELVIIGLGYNSLWERDRRDFDSWAAAFDRDVDQLLATLRSLGGKRFVWVTLREPSPANIPAMGREQERLYVWYFPYVNERLDLVPSRNPDTVLADWAGVSNTAGVTYDAIHLTDDGIRLMLGTILPAAGLEPPVAN